MRHKLPVASMPVKAPAHPRAGPMRRGFQLRGLPLKPIAWVIDDGASLWKTDKTASQKRATAIWKQVTVNCAYGERQNGRAVRGICSTDHGKCFIREKLGDA